ncbi:spore germination protein [Anaerobacillus sp. MEB173]|uniref:spore germination protein n=1 Tax=Anaerobacillus sp. MEB173 TaxID=3383345 RepID=UPI003F90C96C
MSTQVEELLQSQFSFRLENNVKTIESILEENADLVKRNFTFHKQVDVAATYYYVDGLVNSQQINMSILEPLMIYSSELSENHVIGPTTAEHIKKNLLLSSSIELTDSFKEMIDSVLSGDTILFLDHCDQAFIVPTRGWDTRSVAEPETEPIVRGPRDGFVESIRSNTALVRRRIRDPLFRIEELKVGEKSRTDINIAYIKGTVKDGLVEEVKERLQRIKIDAILESGYIEEFIDDAPLSPFITIQNTERPDRAAAAIYEGKVAIFIDNTPFVLIVPTFFWQFFQAGDDYYSNYWLSSFTRSIRYIALILSLTLPSIFVLLVSFHQEMLPTPIAISIAASREALPFPVLFEALMMELAFELMREAGLRMPRPIGQAVSIVGSLVVGQAAVEAGVVSPIMVIVIATTGIASFAIPNYAASFSIRLFRFPLLIASGTLGLLGFASVIIIVLIHALSIRSFGEPYLAPGAPFRPYQNKDMVIRMPWWSLEMRPVSGGEQRRQADHQKPKPPNAKGEDEDHPFIEIVEDTGNNEQEQSKQEKQDSQDQSNNQSEMNKGATRQEKNEESNEEGQDSNKSNRPWRKKRQ